MKLLDIHKYSIKPALYEKGTAEMWTDDHISKQLLQIHLNTETDLASRKKSTIESTANWILSQSDNRKLNILDLGCGPGLYSEILAKKGHQVTGVDYSENSINYAKEQADKKNLEINYIHDNYLKLELEEDKFDLIILIYTDLGVLLPNERQKLLILIHKSLKKGGIFIFDVLNDQSINMKTSPKNWEICNNGFWKNKPYLALSESYLFEQEKVILYQHIVADKNDNIECYRFWTHFFSDNDLAHILSEQSFNTFNFYKDVLPEGNLFSGKNVTFCKAIK